MQRKKRTGTVIMMVLTERMKMRERQWNMKLFNNLRAILTRHKENMPVVVLAEMLAEIDEAEAKWEMEHKSYDVEKVVEQIHDYFCKVIDDYKEDIVPHELLEHNKAICEIVRNGGVE